MKGNWDERRQNLAKMKVQRKRAWKLVCEMNQGSQDNFQGTDSVHKRNQGPESELASSVSQLEIDARIKSMCLPQGPITEALEEEEPYH